MDKYMIVNATQLDSDLKLMADKIRIKLGETRDYEFPQDFEEALDKMIYDENPNTEMDIINNGDGTITIPAGYYQEDIIFTLPEVEQTPEDGGEESGGEEAPAEPVE